MAADPVSHYLERDALIVSLKQQGSSLKMIASVVSLGTSRVGQILQQAGAATDRWVCPLCGDIVRVLGESGWCPDCDEAETGYQRSQEPWWWMTAMTELPEPLRW